MKRRTTRMQKGQNIKTEEDSETNNTKMQINKDEQYVEQEHIQDLIMEGESLEPEPRLHDSPEPITDFLDSEEIKENPKGDEKKTESENNSEEESHDAEESNEKPETVKSEDDADVDDVDEGGNSILQ